MPEPRMLLVDTPLPVSVTSRAVQMCLRILVVDNYDSYTLNLLQLLPEKYVQVVVIQNDQLTWEYLRDNVLEHFDGIILSPGPGTPEQSTDVGVVSDLLRYTNIPILGVCLGHQAIAYMAGGKIVHASTPVHGQVNAVHLISSTDQSALSLFDHISSPFSVVRYHSLMVSETDLPSSIKVLAYTMENKNGKTYNSSSNGRTIMALQHRDKPFYGVQFHPESVCTEHGQLLMHNFLEITARWHQTNGYYHVVQICQILLKAFASLLNAQQLHATPLTIYAQKLPYVTKPDLVFHTLYRHDDASVWLDSARANDRQSQFSLMGSCQSTTGFKVEYYLDSKQVKLQQYCLSATVKLQQPSASLNSSNNYIEQKKTLAPSDTFWDWTSRFMQQFKHVPTELVQTDTTTTKPLEPIPEFDFCTGLVGYFGYEMKQESLPGYTSHPLRDENEHEQHQMASITTNTLSNMDTHSKMPDAAFIFLDRFVSIDYTTGTTWLVALVRNTPPPSPLSNDIKVIDTPIVGMSRKACDAWMKETTQQLNEAHTKETTPLSHVQKASLITAAKMFNPHSIQPRPSDTCSSYLEKIDRAQSLIRDGESYELCLTMQLAMHFSQRLLPCTPTSNSNTNALTTFDFYRQLRNDNPAPYAAYLNLGPSLCVASASPERFLRVSRAGTIQMRPIKGTLKRQRTCCSCAQQQDAELARSLAVNVKERGENLMIVDLIRNDLARICPPHSVRVPQLMTVETYETVHQMVTTVDGSMTGAPKLRSVQLLELLEDHRPRGIYSGCLGYLSINGSADFNVVIRTVVIRDGQAVTIGAGGAITILSDPMEEWHEAIIKADAVLPSLNRFQQTLLNNSNT
ncbi:ADC synthase [Syncephalis fuscata]|nr:ADC synthase [Syncephalis fuscata]